MLQHAYGGGSLAHMRAAWCGILCIDKQPLMLRIIADGQIAREFYVSQARRPNFLWQKNAHLCIPHDILL